MKSLSVVAFSIISLVFAEAGDNLLKPTNKAESWRFEQHEGGKGSMKADGDAMVFTITDVDGTDWHVQAVQPDLDLVADKEYVLKFQIKASEDRNVQVSAMIDKDDWHAIGLAETISVGQEFKNQEFTFKAENVAEKKNRISLALGDAKGTVTVKDMTLTAK
jgi:Carbohydrate binding domain